MSTSARPPSFAETVEFVRRFSGHGCKTIVAVDTRLDADLGITGDDGSDLLEEAARYFGADLASHDGYRTTFGLGPSEYLFHAEGLDLVGVGKVMDWIFGRTRPVARDLTVRQLHEAICRTRRPPPGAV